MTHQGFVNRIRVASLTRQRTTTCGTVSVPSLGGRLGTGQGFLSEKIHDEKATSPSHTDLGNDDSYRRSSKVPLLSTQSKSAALDSETRGFNTV